MSKRSPAKKRRQQAVVLGATQRSENSQPKRYITNVVKTVRAHLALLCRDALHLVLEVHAGAATAWGALRAAAVAAGGALLRRSGADGGRGLDLATGEETAVDTPPLRGRLLLLLPARVALHVVPRRGVRPRRVLQHSGASV